MPDARRGYLSVGHVMLSDMVRHTSFRYCLDPTVEQQHMLKQHAGAARLAFNQCLYTVKSLLSARDLNPDVKVPWSGFDLINHFNVWKKSEAAGRVFTVDSAGTATVVVTGLPWRDQVCQQVFEEAAVDCGQALNTWSQSRAGKRAGCPVGFPRFKKKSDAVVSFRLRNKCNAGRPSIRVGDNGLARSVTLPRIGSVSLRGDTRRLRRMLVTGRARVLFATVTHRAGRWWVTLNLEAADLHQGHRHPVRGGADRGDWIGVDRGLSAFIVAAGSDGRERERVDDSPRALAVGIARQRRLARAVSRKRKGSNNRRRAEERLARHHHRVRNVRTHFLHSVANRLVKNHDRIVLETLNITGMQRNRRLARAIGDAGWARLARMIDYKQEWRGGSVTRADRWFPSSRLCSHCGVHNSALGLADRVFSCPCGNQLDRDLNAAINLATWGETQQFQVREPEARAPVINACGREGAGSYSGAGETSPVEAGTDAHLVAAS